MFYRNIRSGSLALVALLCVAPASWAALSSYSQDFEGLDAGNPDALANDGWLVAGLVYDSGGNFKFFYGNFPAPNGGPAFSGIIAGEGGPDQGAQQLSVYSDYNCCMPGEGHFNGTDLVESRVLQEQTIGPGDVGLTYTFRFDGKGGDLAGSTTALAFIQTLDPNAGFATTNFVSVDTTALPDVWGSFKLSLFIDPSLDGQLLQFGFLSISSNFETSQNIYDNVNFGPAAAVGGSIESGMVGFAARCINQTTSQSVTITPGPLSGWDCTAAGLATNPGDTVLQLVIGSANGGPVAGAIEGLDGIVGACRNLTSGQTVVIPLGGGTTWNCTDAGFVANPGDLTLQLSRGSVPTLVD